MATETAPNGTLDDLNSLGASAPAGGNKKLKILALLAIVMGVEAGAIYFFVPTSAPPGDPAAIAGIDGVDAGDASLDGSGESVEVTIESFNVTNNTAAPGSTIHITFNLVAIVPAEQQLSFEEAANSVHKFRVRQAIVKVARSASLEDLNDPNLSTMKRLIKEEVNKVLRKSVINEVVISDYKTMEQ